MLKFSSGEIIDLHTGTGTVILDLPSDASCNFEISIRAGKLNLTGFDDSPINIRNCIFVRGK